MYLTCSRPDDHELACFLALDGIHCCWNRPASGDANALFASLPDSCVLKSTYHTHTQTHNPLFFLFLDAPADDRQRIASHRRDGACVFWTRRPAHLIAMFAARSRRHYFPESRCCSLEPQ